MLAQRVVTTAAACQIQVLHVTACKYPQRNNLKAALQSVTVWTLLVRIAAVRPLELPVAPMPLSHRLQALA